MLEVLTQYREEATQTAILAALLLAGSMVASRTLARNQTPETQRFWRLALRNLAVLGLLLGSIVIWKTELRSVFLALGAATAAVFLTFRESWLSVLAFWVQLVKRPYSLNDFIEIDGVRGRVIDITWLSTVLAETVPGKGGTIYSGKVVHIPNNRMLMTPLTVDNLTEEYTLHVLTVPLPSGAKPLVAEKLLLEVARRVCEPFYEQARESMKTLEKEKALEISSVEPKTYLSIDEDSSVTVRLRIIVPSEMRSKLHQDILHGFFAVVTADAWPERLPHASP